MSSGAPAPPILVGTQPGVSALDSTLGQRRATAKASMTSCSLLSPYAVDPSHRRLRHRISSRFARSCVASFDGIDRRQDIVEIRVCAIVHARALIDETLRPFDQR